MFITVRREDRHVAVNLYQVTDISLNKTTRKRPQYYKFTLIDNTIIDSELFDEWVYAKRWLDGELKRNFPGYAG